MNILYVTNDPPLKQMYEITKKLPNGEHRTLWRGEVDHDLAMEIRKLQQELTDALALVKKLEKRKD